MGNQPAGEPIEAPPVLTDPELRSLRLLAIQERLHERVIIIEPNLPGEEKIGLRLRVDNFSLGRSGMVRLTQRLKVERADAIYPKVSKRATVEVSDFNGNGVFESLVITLPENEMSTQAVVAVAYLNDVVNEEALRFVLPLATLIEMPEEGHVLAGSEIYIVKRTRATWAEVNDPYIRERPERLADAPKGPFPITARVYTLKASRELED